MVYRSFYSGKKTSQIFDAYDIIIDVAGKSIFLAQTVAKDAIANLTGL
jgi:hypothetical protein